MSIIAIGQTGTYIQGAIDVSVVDRAVSSDTVTLRATFYYRRTNTYSGVTGPATINVSIAIGNTSQTGSASFTLQGGQQNVWQNTGISLDFTVSTGASGTTVATSWAASTSMSQYFDGFGSENYSFTNAPTGLTASNIVPGVESFSANISISGWGGEGNSSTRYRELQCWTYNASSLVEPRRFEPQYGDSTSGDIIVHNNSYASSTPLTIRGNTRYTLGMYASNGTYGAGSRRIGSRVTLPYKDTLTFNSADSESITVDYSVPSDGGYYAKTLEYSVDGSSWVQYDTISGGSAKTGTFTISGLNPNTEYTIQSRVTTTAGTTVNDNLVASTIGPATPRCVLGATPTTNTVIWGYGTTTFGGGTNGIVRLYSDTNSTPTIEVENKSTTGNSNYTLSNLTPNTRYYARARAEAEFDGELVYSDYSETKSAVTKCEAPVINSLGVVSYDTASTVTARANITILADGNALDKNIQARYKLDSGAYTAWTTIRTITSGSAETFNYDISGLDVGKTLTLELVTSTEFDSDVATAQTNTGTMHQGPTNFDWILQDNNTGLQTWLSTFSGYTDPVFVQGQSQVKAFIPSATAGTASDGANITHYIVSLPVDGTSLTIQYISGDMSGMFSTGTPQDRASNFPSNLVTVEAKVYDSLDTYTQVNKQALALSYEDLTLEATGERLQNGGALIRYSGQYARLQDNSLNSGADINSLGTLQYRISDYQDNVLIDWINISGVVLENNSDVPFLKDFSGSVTVPVVQTINSYKIEIKASDHFTEKITEIPMEAWDINQVIYPPNYEIELWDWKTGTLVADISYLVVGSLEIEWNLNDVEQVNFNLDLLRFEEKCQTMGIDSTDLLAPYAHDIRIRRNGEYILGCQLVETNIQLTNNPPAKINIKGTGFLNLLKDQYILSEAWSGYTYAQIARKLVQAAQKPDCLIKNPTIDIDTSYWLANTGTLSYNSNAHSGDGCIMGNKSGTGWISYGSQMNVDSGEAISLDLWVKGQSGRICYVRERKYITQYVDQSTITQITLDGTWQHIQVARYETIFENGYILVEMDRTDNSSALYADDVYVYSVNDSATLNNMNIALGVDTASAIQQPTRQVNYELQNVKDALIDLTQMEDDNFAFEFLPDRTFNVYARKGADKLDLDVSYPGNMESMVITRSAANLANKIIAIGSGIGDERLQIEIPNNPSREVYGTHESVTTDSNISLRGTLIEKAIGNLYDKKDPTNLPQIKIKDGSINPSNIETGDVVLVFVDGVDYIKSATGEYRVIGVKAEVSENGVEEMSLTVEQLPERPEKKMIRYIRDSIGGNSTNVGNHWTEIQALMLVGNEYVNIALGKTVTCSNSAGYNLQKATDGSISQTSGEFAAIPIASSTSRDAITIDLGDEYPIDYIKVWHYYTDGRTYYGEHLSVGAEIDSTSSAEDLEDVLWSYGSTSGYVETSNGRRSKWLQEDNIVYGGDES